MKLDLTMNCKDLDGNDLLENGKVVNLGKSFAQNLMIATTGNPVKFYDWALKLHKVGELEIDREDWELLKNFTNDMKGIGNLYKAQLLEKFILQPEK